jgi:serine protease
MNKKALAICDGDWATSCVAAPDGNYQIGAFFASPLVAGVAALVWAANPAFHAHDVVARIKSTARPVAGLSGLCVTGGVLDASAALGAASCSP